MTSGHPHHRWRAKSNAMATGGAGAPRSPRAAKIFNFLASRPARPGGGALATGGAAPPVGLVVFRSFEIEVPT
jgi:hypothetical protein